MSQPRSAGNPQIASPPAASSSHSSSGLPTPPGNRQLIPTTATGSPSTATIVGAPGTSLKSPSNSARR